MTNENLEVIQEKIGYKFNNGDLLIQAFTRKSFAAENVNWKDNEGLEFVGDKVLDFVVVKKLTEAYGHRETVISKSLQSIENGEKACADNLVERSNYEFSLTEGEMTEIKKQIVQTSFLAMAIENLGLEAYLMMGKGDVKGSVQNEPHVKEDLFEAIIGAIAIDSCWNIPVLEAIIQRLLNLDYYIKNGVEDGADYVSYVQNWYQREYGKAPDYFFYDTEEEDSFWCDLTIHGGITFEGYGYSKKAAIKMAAKRELS